MAAAARMEPDARSPIARFRRWARIWERARLLAEAERTDGSRCVAWEHERQGLALTDRRHRRRHHRLGETPAGAPEHPPARSPKP